MDDVKGATIEGSASDKDSPCVCDMSQTCACDMTHVSVTRVCVTGPICLK